MGFQKIDKKQMPQVIGLGVVSCGMFGYFAVKMMAPTASAAPPPPAKKADVTVAAAANTPGAGPVPGTTAASGTAPATDAATPDAPPPTPGMRDPFIPAISDATAPTPPAPVKMQVASRVTSDSDALHLPAAPPLPSVEAVGDRALAPLPGASSPTASLAPMPVVLSAPPWTVTGVVRSGPEEMVILRSGEARRIVRAGEMVDAHFRIADVTRDYVVLRHGAQSFTLPLGGPKIVPAAKRPPAPQGTEFSAPPAAPGPPTPTVGAASSEAQASDPAAQAQRTLQAIAQKLGVVAQTPADTPTPTNPLPNITGKP